MSSAALIVRRLCHDFAGPAGAIGTALNMLGEALDPELFALAQDGSTALTAVIELYRYAATPAVEPLPGARAKTLTAAWLAIRGEVTLDWPDDETPWPPGFAALTAGLVMITAGAAPRGTRLAVAVGDVVAPGTTLPPDIVAALAGETATTARAALAGALAEQAQEIGVTLETSSLEGAARLTASYQTSSVPQSSLGPAG